MGAIGGCCCCWIAGELPTVSVEGMHVVGSGWGIIPVTGYCCAEITLEFDADPAWTVVDAGDVMTFDKATLQEWEMFDNPVTCLRPFIVTDPDAPIPRPVWTGCCSDPVVVNRITDNFRNRGGKRFVYRYRPKRLRLRLQKTSVVCGGVTSTKIVASSVYEFESVYEYVDYWEQTYTRRMTSTAACWARPPDQNIRSNFPFNISYWSPGAQAVIGGWYWCRRKILDEMPTGSLSFGDGDRGDASCGSLAIDCWSCGVYSSDVCFDTGATGPTEPFNGFCAAIPADGIWTLQWYVRSCSGYGWINLDGSHGIWTNGGIDDRPDACLQTHTHVGPGGPGTIAMLNSVDFRSGSGYCETMVLECLGPYSPYDVYRIPKAARRITSSITLTCSGYTRRTSCVSFPGWGFTL